MSFDSHAYIRGNISVKHFDHTKRVVGDKAYEGANHLDNVLVVYPYRKIKALGTGIVLQYTADVIAYNDYEPFGAALVIGIQVDFKPGYYDK